jgi:hypothetical protein
MDSILNSELDKNIKKIISVVKNSRIYNESNLAKNLCAPNTLENIETDFKELITNPMLNMLLMDDMLCISLNIKCGSLHSATYCKEKTSELCYFISLVKQLILTLQTTYESSIFCQKTIDLANIIKKIKGGNLLEKAENYVDNIVFINGIDKLSIVTANLRYFIHVAFVILAIIICVFVAYKLIGFMFNFDSSNMDDFRESNLQIDRDVNYKYPYFENSIIS